MAPKKRNVRILCLDGGGVKGVTSLHMLKEIMAKVDELEKLKGADGRPGTPEHPLKPCQYFDLICGTSTGGLIALMLGRLEYTVDDAIKKYQKLGREIFEKKLPWLTRWDATYDHKTLEECLKDVIEKAPLDPRLSRDELFKDPSRRCKTFVITTTLLENSPRPALLRSYDTERGENIYPAFTGKIWEAGRATSAAPTFFKPYVYEEPTESDSGTAEEWTGIEATEEYLVEKTTSKPLLTHTYSDGATIANNPTFEAIMEACRLWEPSAIDCIVSLGTGPEGKHTLENAPLEVLGPWGVWLLEKTLSRSMFFRLQLAFYSLQKMTGTEYVHHNATDAVLTFRGSNSVTAAGTDDATPEQVYFRLNVTDSEAKVGLDAWEKMTRLMELADEYMKDPMVRKPTEAIAKILIRSDEEVSRRRGRMKGPPPENDDIFGFRIFIFTKVHGPPQYQETRCKLDTGSESNFVSKTFVEKWSIPRKLLVGGDKVTFQGIGGKSFMPAFTITLRFTLGNSSNTFTDQFFVVDKLVAEVILGSKFIVENAPFLFLQGSASTTFMKSF